MNTSNKGKRSRESSESNKSFVKNVTSRMSGLLPTTITKWFSSPSSSNANGSATVVDATDSSTEDEAPDISTIQPPTKRMRLSPSASSHFRANNTKCSSTNTDSSDFIQASMLNSPGKCAYFKRDPNFMSTPVNPKADESTMKTSESENRMSNTLKRTLFSGDASMVKNRKTLFNFSPNDKSRKNEDKSYSDVQKEVNRSYNKSLLGSPFYPGRTTYGGAASSSYLKNSNIHKNKNTVVNETKSNDNLHVSHSARRMMELLENYSSPLTEARRISQYVKPDKSLNSSYPDCKKVITYKTQELHVPTIASILSIKRRSRLMDTTSAARQLVASHSSSINLSPYPTRPKSDPQEKDTTAKFVTKIKSTLRKNKTEHAKPLQSFVTPPPLDLPTAVLQINKDNLPKFSFESSVSKSQVTTTISLPLHSSTPLTKTAVNIFEPENSDTYNPLLVSGEKSKSLPKSSCYTFSRPVTVSSDSVTSSKLPVYSFLSPERTVDRTKIHDTKNDSISSIVGTSEKNEIASANTSNWKCNDCWVSNKPDVDKCVCCGGKKSVIQGTKNCSVCKFIKCSEYSDVCSGCKKKTNNLPKCDSSKWKCCDCWVSNDSNVEKCVCCGGKKPGNPSEISKSESPVSTPKVETSKWKCEDCWVSNDINVDKCVCCGGKKPKNETEVAMQESTERGWKCDVCLLDNKPNIVKCIACLTSKPSSSPASKPVQNSSTSNLRSGSNDLFKDIVKKQAQKWECPYCLAQNEINKIQCVCCDSEKPGSYKQTATKFNFGQSPNTTFKFGIDPKIATEKEKSAESNPAAKETNNNDLPKATFTFGIPPSKTDNTVSNDKEKPKDTSAAAFSFGIPKEIQNKPTISNEVTVNESKSEAEKKENAQEVPNIDSNEIPKTKLQFSSTLFTNPAPPAQSLPSTTTPSTLSLTTSTSVEAKPGLTQSKSMNIPASSAMSLSNLFKSPTSSTVESTNTFIKPVETSALNSTTTLFQKSEPPKTSINFTAPPLFQKSEAQQVATAAPSFTKIDPQNSANTTSPFQKNELPAPSVTLFQNPGPTAVTTTMSLFSTGAQPISSTPNLFQKNDPPTTSQTATSAPLFSFGLNAQSAITTEKPKFNFSFGSNTKIGANMFTNTNTNTPAFGGINDNSNKFGTPTSSTGGITNVLSNNAAGNGLASGNILGGNGLGANTLGSSNLSSQSMSTGNTLQSSVQLPTASSGIFGTPTQKENNAWPSTNNQATNLFATTAPTNSAQKPASFTFGSNNMSFNMVNNNSVPVFGANTQPAQNVFGMANPNTNNTTSLFSTPVQNQSTPSMFGSAQPASNPAPAIGLFGQQNVNPTFGSTTSTFEPSQNQSPAPAFNFGSSQPSGVFGFGQQAQQQPQPQPQQAGMYSFGTATPPGSQVQFSVGSAPNMAIRRVRKAVRRTSQR